MNNERKIIMLVDGNAANFAAGKEMLKDVYKIYPVISGEILFDLLEDIYPDMILLDAVMPETDGYEVIRKLKNNKRWADIPVVFLTAPSDDKNEYMGLHLGAIDNVPKYRHMDNMQNTVLGAISGLVEFRDDGSGGHIMRTQKYLKILIEQMIEDGVYMDEVSSWDLNFLLPSAQLYDVGKIAISDDILRKKGALTPEEFVVMMSHVEEGIKAVDKIEDSDEEHKFFRHVRLIVGSHHEKWDGTGYPNGFRGTEIPLEGRLMAIADVYDALVTKRPYKKTMTADEANMVIKEGSNKHFDPLLVDVFLKVADRFAEVVRKATPS